MAPSGGWTRPRTGSAWTRWTLWSRSERSQSLVHINFIDTFPVFFQSELPEILEFFCKYRYLHKKLVPQPRLRKCTRELHFLLNIIIKSLQASFSHLMFIIPTYFGMIPVPPIENVHPVIEDVPRNEPLRLWNRLFCPQCVLHIVGVNTLVVSLK